MLLMLLEGSDASLTTTKILIVVGANVLFFGLVALIWVAARVFPEWDARQRQRQRERDERLASSADEERAHEASDEQVTDEDAAA